MPKRSLFTLLILLFLTPVIHAATIQLPQTGQTGCYNESNNVIPCSTTGQDGELQKGTAWPNPRFTVNNNGTVTDNLTGLVWLKNANCAAINLGPSVWATALANANALANGACGLTDASAAGDWRLPNIVELESLVDLSQDNPPLPADHPFSNVQSSLYWSSSTSANITGTAWSLSMVNGYVYDDYKSTKRLVWPVRDGLQAASVTLPRTGQTSCWDAGGTLLGSCNNTGQDAEKLRGAAWPSPRFTNPDSTTPVGGDVVLDQLSGLIWAKDANLPAAAKTWQQALDFVAAMNGANSGTGTLGHNDWRLPNRKELLSLLDRQQTDPALPSDQPFSNLQAEYWTSDSYTHIPSLTKKWAVNTQLGYTDYLGASESYYVLPVRGPVLPVVSVSPLSKSFGPVATNTTSTAQTFTISNSGTAGLAVAGIATVGGSSTMFNIDPGDGTTGTCGSLTPLIAAGTSCSVSVTFTPSSAGVKSSTLRISSNDLAAPFKDASLSGNIPLAITDFSVQGVVKNSYVVPVTAFTISEDAAASGYLITESAIKPAGNASGWSIARPESFTVSSYGPWTLYAWVRDADNVVSASISAAVDVKPIKIGSATAATSVEVTLSYPDALQMQFMHNNSNWTAWLAYAANTTIKAPAGDGIKTIFVRFKDVNGVISNVFSDSTILDSKAPIGAISINDGASLTTTAEVTLKLAVSDLVPGVQMSFSNDKITWSSWEAFNNTKQFTLNGSYGTKTVYARFMDVAGRISASTSGSILYSATPAPDATGTNLTINGNAKYATSTKVTLGITKPEQACSQMSFSTTNGNSWTTWEDVNSSRIISLPSGDGIKIVYLKFRNTGNIEYGTTYKAGIILDTKAPGGTISINNGAYSTNSRDVALNLSASDVNWVTDMQLLYNGTNWGDWEPFAVTKNITLPLGNGVKKVSVRYRDAAGKVSVIYSDTIILNSLGPVGTVKINAGAASTTNSAVTLTMAAPGAVFMQTSLDGGMIWSDWEPFTTTKKVTLDDKKVILGDVAGIKIIAVKFRDITGNVSAIPAVAMIMSIP
jgi:hypothetical protein